MSLSISSIPTTDTATAANSAAAAPAAAAPQRVQQPTPTTAADTVTLTEAQQVYQLHNQGKTVTQIASSLSLSINLVNNYLGINSGG